MSDRPVPERAGNWADAGGLAVADRPAAPSFDGAGSNPDNPRMLVAVHDHLRRELQEIRDAARAVAADRLSPAQARSVINRMTVRQNHWQLGSFCAAYCRVVTVHHTIEDQQLFPRLAAVADGLLPVLTRLSAEHEVIHAVLERFDQALVGLVADRTGNGQPDPGGLRSIIDLADCLSDQLLSHLAYEEDQLSEGLARLPGFL